MSAPKIFAPEYYERMRALEDASWWNAGMRNLTQKLLSGAGLPTRGTLLNVGCGSGQTMLWFRHRWPGWDTFGLDVARDGLYAARASAEQGVLAASALDLPLPDSCVNVAITLDVLQHLPLGGGSAGALGDSSSAAPPRGPVRADERPGLSP